MLMLFTLILAAIFFCCNKTLWCKHVIPCRDLTKEKSATNVCNVMVHNPIYDGPVYESVQGQFESLNSNTLLTEGTTDNSCNSQSSTPTTVSDNTVRYTDPPVQRSKNGSNSFISSIPPHSSTPDRDTENVPRSTSIIKKNGKERNKLHLTLALTENNLNLNAEPQDCQNHNPLPTDGETNRVMLTNVDEHYMVMSPAGMPANSVKEGWCELSPEDIAQKYKE